MNVGAKLQTSNPALLLRDQEGIFRVSGPGGQVELYECVPNQSIGSITFVEKGPTRGNYLIEKLASRASDREPARARAAAA
jgi:hypothetical protein